MPTVLEIDSLSKKFGSGDSAKLALDHVSLRLRAGRTHVLLGLSGSGKSTLIKIIIGLLAPDSGIVKINDREAIFDRRQAEWSRMIGYVPQEGGLFPHLTCAQNITLVAELAGKTDVRKRLDELCELVSLNRESLSRYPRELSGGQRQRVALMRAAFLDPALLILDEPLGALDPLIRLDVQNELKKIFQSLGKSVLMVTHDIDEARFFGDELSLMREGKIVQTGTFEDLVTRPAEEFVTRFIKSQRIWETL